MKILFPLSYIVIILFLGYELLPVLSKGALAALIFLLVLQLLTFASIGRTSRGLKATVECLETMREDQIILTQAFKRHPVLWETYKSVLKERTLEKENKV